MTLLADRSLLIGAAASADAPVSERFVRSNVVTTPVEADRALSAKSPAASRGVAGGRRSGCGACGGGMLVYSRKGATTRAARAFFYACPRARVGVCQNTLEVDMETAYAAAL